MIDKACHCTTHREVIRFQSNSSLGWISSHVCSKCWWNSAHDDWLCKDSPLCFDIFTRRIQPCGPNPNCVSTSSNNMSYAVPWSIPPANRGAALQVHANDNSTLDRSKCFKLNRNVTTRCYVIKLTQPYKLTKLTKVWSVLKCKEWGGETVRGGRRMPKQSPMKAVRFEATWGFYYGAQIYFR